MEQKIMTPVTKGLILSLVFIVIDLFATFAGFKYETWFRWVPTLLLVAFIIWACINYANQKNNEVTFGNVFAHGFKTSAVIACITVIYVILSVLVLFPEQKDKALEMARQQMEARGNVPESAIEQGLEMTKKFFVPFAIAGAVVGTLLVGVIASLVGAGVAKKNPPTPFQ